MVGKAAGGGGGGGLEGAGGRELEYWPFKCSSSSCQFFPTGWIILCRRNQPAPFIKLIFTGSVSFSDFLNEQLFKIQSGQYWGSLLTWGYAHVKLIRIKKSTPKYFEICLSREMTKS